MAGRGKWVANKPGTEKPWGQDNTWQGWQQGGRGTDQWKEQNKNWWTESGEKKWDEEKWGQNRSWENDESWKDSGSSATRQDEGHSSKPGASGDQPDENKGEDNSYEHSQHYEAHEPESENDGSDEIMQTYIRQLPHDSFSSSAMRLQIEEETQGDEFVATLNLTPACPIRRTFQSEKCTTRVSARRRVVVLAVEELKNEGLLEPIKAAVVPSTGQWPHQCPDQMPLQYLGISRLQGVAEWPTAMVLSKITLSPEQSGWASFGCLSARALPAERPGFALQFELGEFQPIARIEPSVLPGWPPSSGATAHIQAYNHKILPDGPETIMIVPLTRGNIDWDRICGVSSKGKEEVVPVWLLALSQRIGSLQRLEQLGRLAPIGPVPNPLRMEAVLGASFGEGGQAFQALSLQGRAALKMLFAVTLFVECPFDDARRLEERIQAATTPERLAALIAKSGLLAEVLHAVPDWIPRLSGVDVEIAEQMLTALVGAYVGEKGGDFYSVVKLWQWLTDSDELKTAVRYLDCATTEYRGRTPTYENFKQVEADDGTLELHVYYGGGGSSADLGEVRYRRPDVSKQLAQGQYWLMRDQENGQGQWCNVQYDHRQATYVWTAFQVTDAYNNPMPAALPNKVQRWLRGTPASALINYKRCGGPTLVHDALREMRDGSLRVLYKNHGWYCYKRCPKGGLGFEAPCATDTAASEPKPVLYSEKPGEKTLFSPNFEQEPLPNKVTEWLMTGKSLYQLVSIVSSQSVGEEVNVTEHDSDYVSWEAPDGEQWQCHRVHVGCAIIFTAGMRDKLDELMYQGQSCTTPDKVLMPEKVIKWLKKHPERKCDEKVFKAYIEQQRKPNTTMCTPAPLQMQAWFPQLGNIDLGHLEKALQHAFSNRMLLAEALLQTSGNGNNMTPDFQRLAVVGNAVAEQLVTRILVENATFSTSATLSQHDKVANTETDNPWSGTFAVGPNASLTTTDSPTYQWPEARGGLTFGAEWPIIDDIDLTTPEKLRKRLDACCNNVAYARTCVELGLHKGMLQGSTELARSVRTFAKLVEKTREDYEKHGTDPWPRLLQHDAPRALGNTFVACIGATVMDGAQGVQSYSYLDAKKVLVKHVEDCKHMPISDSVILRPHDSEDITLANIKSLKDSRTLFYNALGTPSSGTQGGAPEPTPVPTLSPHASEVEQVNKALKLTDVHFRCVNNVVVDARSPRSAELRAPYVDLELDSDSEDEEQTGEEGTEAALCTESGAAKYCEDCEMWLNGPTQWEDHKIGKKHKKNVKKGGANKGISSGTPTSVKSKTLKTKGGTPPPPPAPPHPDYEASDPKAATMDDTNVMPPYGYAPPPPPWGYPVPVYPYGPTPYGQFVPYPHMMWQEGALPHPPLAQWQQAEQAAQHAAYQAAQAEAEPNAFPHQ